ncbi:unannotated protein [freshwater metagenome]|uniref:Unannotated protein n=1 Tax=freshwater metagenome TaxID=449393 RepID=A0A6J6G0Q8_9ZZZZ
MLPAHLVGPFQGRLRLSIAASVCEDDVNGSVRSQGEDHVEVRCRCRGRGSRFLRHVPAEATARCGVLASGPRGRRRRRRHLVLEPLPRRPLRHLHHRLPVHVGPRAARTVDVVREARGPTRDPGIRAVRRQEARPLFRHRLRRAREPRCVGRRHQALVRPHVHRRDHHLSSLRDGHRMSLGAQGTRHPRRRAFPRWRVRHWSLAPRRSRLHGEEGGRHRYRILGHPVHPPHRRAGR